MTNPCRTHTHFKGDLCPVCLMEERDRLREENKRLRGELINADKENDALREELHETRRAPYRKYGYVEKPEPDDMAIPPLGDVEWKCVVFYHDKKYELVIEVVSLTHEYCTVNATVEADGKTIIQYGPYTLRKGDTLRVSDVKIEVTALPSKEGSF